MIKSEDYYTAPTDEIFNDIKQGAIKIWKTYDDTYGYATEKIGNIIDLNNVRDNYAYIVAMFDYSNQFKLVQIVDRKDTKLLITNLIT